MCSGKEYCFESKSISIFQSLEPERRCFICREGLSMHSLRNGSRVESTESWRQVNRFPLRAVWQAFRIWAKVHREAPQSGQGATSLRCHSWSEAGVTTELIVAFKTNEIMLAPVP